MKEKIDRENLLKKLKDTLKTKFDSPLEKYVFGGLLILTLFTAIFTFATFSSSHDMGMESNEISGNVISSLSAKTPQEMYKKFQCSCCGESIDANCCGMAKQRMEHVDQLMLGGLNENEVTVKMVKKFGFDILMDPSEEDKIKEFIQEQAPDNPPKIIIEPTTKNLGLVKQSEGKVSTFFTLKNLGDGDLVIENMDTSCMCTSVRIIYNGNEGPIFGMSMHGTNPENYKLTIAPGDSAQLEVLYDPLAHGIQKKSEARIIREVTIVSNDPVDFQKKLRIELTQIP
jgi:cytochrome c-type biogenesis protein CcmH/NrfF